MFQDPKWLLSKERAQELRAAAARTRRPVQIEPRDGEVTLRYASPADERRLRYLAELDSTRLPAGTALIAEVDGTVRAALPLDGGPPISDPFHRTAELIELLRLRAAQLGQAESSAHA